MIIRPACAAGKHYPANPNELIATIAKLLLMYPTAEVNPRALVVPHNAINQCGQIAAAAYRHLSQRISQIKKVVIISSSENESAYISLPASDQFRTPLGTVPVDSMTLDYLLELPFVEINDTPHFYSPRIEVQLPYLQTCLAEFSIIPVLVGDVPKDELSLFFHRIPLDRNTLVILSLDVVKKDLELADLDEQTLFVSFIEYCNEIGLKASPALSDKEQSSQDIALSFVIH